MKILLYFLILFKIFSYLHFRDFIYTIQYVLYYSIRMVKYPALLVYYVVVIVF